MSTHIVVHRLRSSAKLFAILALWVHCPLSSWAQVRTDCNNTQAVFHIRVQAMPIVLLPIPDSNSNPVPHDIIYNVPIERLEVDAMKESRPLGKGSAAMWSQGTRGSLLETTTVVPH
jgi:hypothetical protein